MATKNSSEAISTNTEKPIPIKNTYSRKKKTQQKNETAAEKEVETVIGNTERRSKTVHDKDAAKEVQTKENQEQIQKAKNDKAAEKEVETIIGNTERRSKTVHDKDAQKQRETVIGNKERRSKIVHDKEKEVETSTPKKHTQKKAKQIQRPVEKRLTRTRAKEIEESKQKPKRAKKDVAPKEKQPEASASNPIPKKRKVIAHKKTNKKKAPPLQDEDTESDEPLSKKQKKSTPQKKTTPKKKKDTPPDTSITETVQKQFYSMRNRCSPGSMYSIIQALSKQQKECVMLMGFGSLLKMKLIDVPGHLSFYALQNFSTDEMHIKIDNSYIQVTKQSVQEMLGIPMGEIQLTELPKRNEEDTCLEDFNHQFVSSKNIRLQELKNEIICTDEADMNFKLNFITLFINTFCESTPMGKCITTPLDHISTDTDIANIDWCSYLLDCLVQTKRSYVPYKDNNYFVGPTAYLVLLYVDSVQSEALRVTRKRPVICHWSNEKVKYREQFEEKTIGAFGCGELNEPYLGEDDGEEQSEDDESEDEDMTEEAFESKITKLKERLALTVEKAISKYPDNKIFKKEKEISNKEKESDEDEENEYVQSEVQKSNDDGDNVEGQGRKSNENVEGDQTSERENPVVEEDKNEKENVEDGNVEKGKETAEKGEKNEKKNVQGENEDAVEGNSQDALQLSQFWLSPTVQHMMDQPLHGTEAVVDEKSIDDTMSDAASPKSQVNEDNVDFWNEATDSLDQIINKGVKKILGDQAEQSSSATPTVQSEKVSGQTFILKLVIVCD